MLGARVLVLESFGFLLGGREDGTQTGGEAGLGAALDLGELVEERPRRLRDGTRVDVHLAEHGGHDAIPLFHEREEQVLGPQLGVSVAVGELLRCGDRLLGLFGISIEVHVFSNWRSAS